MATAGPLAGVRIAVTRPGDRAASLTVPLEAAGAATRCFPLIRVVPPQDDAPLRSALERLPSFDWVVFTSASAVRALRMSVGGPLPALRRVAVVGKATASAASTAGWPADLIADSSVAEGVADAMVATGKVRGAAILWPRAAAARPVLADTLRAAGAVVTDPIAYGTEADRAQAVALAAAVGAGELDVVTFTSPSAVRSFTEGGGSIPARVLVAAIGPVTADAVRAAGLPVHILPSDPSAANLADAIVLAIGDAS